MPWWLSVEDLEQTDLALWSWRGCLWQGFTRGEVCRVHRWAGTGRNQQDAGGGPHSALLPPCWCLWFQGRQRRKVPICVFHSSLLSGVFSCSLPFHRDPAFRKTLNVSCKLENLSALCWKVNQAHLHSFQWPLSLSPQHCMSLSMRWHTVGLAWFLLLLCLLHVILRSGRENPERLNSWWLLLGSSGKRSSWGRKWKRLTQKSFLVSLWLRLHHPCSQPLIDSCVCGLGCWAPIQGMEDTMGGCLDTHQDLTGFKLYLPDCVSLTFTHIF